jgi:hypothetical protein
LQVRKGSFVLQIYVYLFQQALICVSEEKKKGLRGFLSSSSSSNSLRHLDDSGGGGGKSKKDKAALKLTGRIYLHHVKRIVDSSIPGELSLTIAMEDEALDSFILTFKDRGSHETWRRTLVSLLEEVHGRPFERAASPRPPGPSGQGGKLARMGFDETTLASVSGGDTLSPASASTGGFPRTFSPISPDSVEATTPQRSQSLVSTFGSAPLAPMHTPIDLVIVASLAPQQGGTVTASAAMKLRIIKSTMEFALRLLGPRDRLSFVTFEPEQGGRIRRTPFLCPGKQEGRRKLDTFVAGLSGTARLPDDDEDPYLVEFDTEDKVDVVAGVNTGLDVIMQRRLKNPLTGMLLVSDSLDSIKRAQMDLLLARAEAAR